MHDFEDKLLYVCNYPLFQTLPNFVSLEQVKVIQWRESYPILSLSYPPVMLSSSILSAEGEYSVRECFLGNGIPRRLEKATEIVLHPPSYFKLGKYTSFLYDYKNTRYFFLTRKIHVVSF